MAKAEPVIVKIELSDETKAAIAAFKKTATDGIDANAVETALREVINDLDYDLHKNIECDEETGDDTYPDIANNFIRAYKEAVSA